jgi:uncharacterized protein involved in exopolysaccharide biosynthesis
MSDVLDLRDYFDILIRRWRVVLAMPALAAIAAALVTFAIKPTYEATAAIALAPSTVSISLANQLPPYYLVVDSPRRLPTAYTPAYYIAILNGAEVVNAAAPRAEVLITSDGSDRSLIRITARGGDPQQVADTANRYAQAGAARIQQLLIPSDAEVVAAKKQFDAAEQAIVKFAQDNSLDYDLAKFRAAPLAVPAEKKLELARLMRERDIAESVYQEFARDLQRGAILANNAYRPSIIAAPVPTAPIAPRFAQNVLMGAAFGLLLGILAAFALDFLARR